MNEYTCTARIKRQACGSLLDRGANGGIAGDDVCFLTKSDHSINVTGIHDHQITGLSIGTAAGRIITQQGPAIVLLHEYALLGRGCSVHS